VTTTAGRAFPGGPSGIAVLLRSRHPWHLRRAGVAGRGESVLDGFADPVQREPGRSGRDHGKDEPVRLLF
jgi:hypothetical protein